ncbi:MAG TPA: Crp/Fnr family transcriptional regulator [Vicinamibacterales bacterium]|jgi:CRP/FNR family transcriptional regulator
MKKDVGIRRGTPGDTRPSIRAVPFLQGPPVLRLTSREREHLASIATMMRVPAGTILCHAGHEARALFSVTSGTLASYRERRDGTRKVFAFLFAEDLFGLARRGHYVNSVKAITPATVYRMPLDTLAALLTRDGTLQFRFLCKVTQVLRDAQRQALMTAVRDPVERVALFLAMLDEVQGERREPTEPVHIPMTRQDVADYLNLTSGSIRAAVDALEDRGIVRRIPPDGIAITDRKGFDALVDGDAD